MNNDEEIRTVRLELREARGEIAALVTENRKLDAALRAKDQAMCILFDRLARAGVDCSDLIS